MKRDDASSWLWRQLGAVTDHPTDLLSDETLAAYRQGQLSPEEREAVEEILIRSSSHRARLIEQVSDQVTHAPPQLRDRVRFRTTSNRTARRFGRTLRSYFAVAAIAAGILVPLTLWVWSTGRNDSNLAAVQFQVQVFGSAEVRSEGREGVADPGSSVEVRVESAGKDVEGLYFGIYRVAASDSHELRRVPEKSYLQSDRHRSAVWIRLPAAELSDREPGTYTFYVVIADSELPDRVTASAEATTEDLERSTGGKAYPLELEIRRSTD